MGDFVKGAQTNEIEAGSSRLVDITGKSIALINVEGQFVALDTVELKSLERWESEGGSLEGGPRTPVTRRGS